MPTQIEKLPDSHLITGYEVHHSNRPLDDKTHDVKINFRGTNYSYDDVLAHKGECPPYNTFACQDKQGQP